MIRILRYSLAVSAMLAFAAPSAQASIKVDGSLDDWDVAVMTATSGVNPGTTYGLSGIAGYIGAHVEDTNDLSNNYHVGPNYGGQNYDAEMLAVAMQSNNLLIAILSGQRPDNDFNKYSPGDIRLITSESRVFGIEVGGGINVGGDDGGIVREGDLGTFYTLNGSGYTTGVTTDTNKLAGQLWETSNASDWYTDPIGPASSTQLQLTTTGGTLRGTADYVFTRNSAVDTDGDRIDSNLTNNQHSVIELSLSMNAFGLADNEKIVSVEWRPSCGNDELMVQPFGGFGSPPQVVPEPASVLVWGLLAFSGYGFRRRSRRSTI